MPPGLPHHDDPPPLDESGELQLSPDLQQLADTLRGDAARMSEQVVPQAAAGRLMRELAVRLGESPSPAGSSAARIENRRSSPIRRTRTKVAVALLLLGLVGGTASQLIFWPSSSGTSAGSPANTTTGLEPEWIRENRETRPRTKPDEKWTALDLSPPGAGRDWGNINAPPPEATSLGFLAEQRPLPTGLEESPDAWVGDARRLQGELLMTNEEKLRLLEQALDRYRSVIEFQQERIRTDQEELREARAEIERLERALDESGFRARKRPLAGAEALE
jgi:hypothetical protein